MSQPSLRSASRRTEIVVSTVAAVGSAIAVVTCSAIGTQSPTAATTSARASAASPPIASASAAPAVVASVSPSAPASSSSPPPTARPWPSATSAEGNAIPHLPKFFDALAALKNKQRTSHVRVAWIGDSHTQADFWTHAVRTSLQSRFGNGGPGFVHVGWAGRQYHHEGVKSQVQGPWYLVPKTLVASKKVTDGVFGLGGVRLTPADPVARASVSLTPEQLPCKSKWDFAVRLPQNDAALSLGMTGAPRVNVRGNDAAAGALDAIRHLLFDVATPGGSLDVIPAGGGPELMGVTIECAEGSGVVLDTLGLSGARVDTWLALDEAAWVGELKRRSPELVVIALGSNESAAGDRFNGSRHTQDMSKLIARARMGAPGAECVVFGAIDRGKYEDVIERINEAQRKAAAESGCAYWSGQKAMGGKGSMIRWSLEVPQLGQKDLLHLTARGYEKVGKVFARDLLQGFDTHTAP